MHFSTLIIVLLCLMALAYYLGRRRSLNLVSGRVRNLHSLPSYYGMQTALWCGIPALLLFVIWVSFERAVMTGLVVEGLPSEIQSLPTERLNLVLNDIRNLAQGDIVSRAVDETMQKASDHYASLKNIS
ncbi:MAG: phosphate ABC transporter permease family protein, partial [Candidatus Thiodiazotropha sp. (ex Cardiolucina cf. quadrata)]|nr:phosphate ABC transporter permease family protein [Candidatus Thiodiazotropha sp. (ex Cardiolucina cf. quadrata)]